MPRGNLSPEVLALIHLRSAAGLSVKELAARLGMDPREIYRYEGGEKRLRRADLDAIAVGLGSTVEAVDTLLFVQTLTTPEPQEEDSPVALSPAESRRIDRAALHTGWTVAAGVRESLRQRKRMEKAAVARQEAEEMWKRLKTVPPTERRDLVTVLPELRSWALTLRICEASVRAAADDPAVALELADLALLISERLPGSEKWRSRMKGYSFAHLANARRVANDLDGANAAFAQAWNLWRDGTLTDSELLPEWRLFDLEASLRREERQFRKALELLQCARSMASAGGDTAAAARILLKKEFTLEQMGDLQGAMAALAEAAPYVEASGDPRQLFALRFKAVNYLLHSRRYGEAAERLPEVREMAVRLGNGLDLLRVLWLEARLLAAQGRQEEAAARLEQVRQDFTIRQLPYDAALSSMDLAVLWLEAGRMADVREIALTMAWIFKGQGIAREALAALSLFFDAVQQETATVELARRVIGEIEQARSAPPLKKKRKGRE